MCIIEIQTGPKASSENVSLAPVPCPPLPVFQDAPKMFSGHRRLCALRLPLLLHGSLCTAHIFPFAKAEDADLGTTAGTNNCVSLVPGPVLINPVGGSPWVSEIVRFPSVYLRIPFSHCLVFCRMDVL